MTVDTGKTVVVFGGSGFLGRYVVQSLAKRGHRVKIACRRPDLAYHILTAGNLGSVLPIQANLRYPWSVERAVKGVDHVVNLVGILAEGGKQTFSGLQAEGAKLVADAAKAEGVGMTQVSAIGADENSNSKYARTKAAGEKAVFEARPDAYILRPSIIFGPEDEFFNRFAEMTKLSPFIPLLGGGKTKFQPIYVVDVAEAVAKTVDGEVKGGTIYELGGPEVLTFKQLMEEMLRVIDRKRRFLTIPFSLAGTMAKYMKFVPNAPITPDQVKQLQNDNVVSDAAMSDGRTVDAFDIRPRTIESILPTYLVRFRPQGQFTRPTRHAGGLDAENQDGLA